MGIEPSFAPDINLLKTVFYQRSRQYHPDFYTHASAQQQEEALEMSSWINKAYLVLQNPTATLEYLLTEQGLLTQEEKYQLSPEFLMEVMELNEQITDAKLANDEAQLADLKAQVNNMQAQAKEKLASIFAKNPQNCSSAEWAQLKDFYFVQKYLHRILATE
jgi:molecular chaperone HscB